MSHDVKCKSLYAMPRASFKQRPSIPGLAKIRHEEMNRWIHPTGAKFGAKVFMDTYSPRIILFPFSP